MSDNKLGIRIRRYREKLQLSQEALAEKSGVPLRTVVEVEEGRCDPVLGIRIRLARALGQRLGTFVDDVYTPAPVVSRKDEREQSEVADVEHTPEPRSPSVSRYYALAKGKADRAMEPFFIEFPAGAKADYSSHEGEEFIVCVSGTVSVDHGGTIYTLKPGDSIYYDAIVKHKAEPAGEGPASLYAVVYLPL